MASTNRHDEAPRVGGERGVGGAVRGGNAQGRMGGWSEGWECLEQGGVRDGSAKSRVE